MVRLMNSTKINTTQFKVSRNILNLTQAEVATSVNIATQSYSAIENGKSDPKVSTFNRIIDYFESLGIEFINENQINYNSETKITTS